jgi:hypothetical protein
MKYLVSLSLLCSLAHAGNDDKKQSRTRLFDGRLRESSPPSSPQPSQLPPVITDAVAVAIPAEGVEISDTIPFGQASSVEPLETKTDESEVKTDDSEVKVLEVNATNTISNFKTTSALG